MDGTIVQECNGTRDIYEIKLLFTQKSFFNKIDTLMFVQIKNRFLKKLLDMR